MRFEILWTILLEESFWLYCRSNASNVSRGRISSENCILDKTKSKIIKSASSVSAGAKRRGFSFGSNKSSIEEKKDQENAAVTDKRGDTKSKLALGNRKKILEKKRNSTTSDDGDTEQVDNSGKRVTNLKDFYSLTKSPTSPEKSSSPGSAPGTYNCYN